ncbi:MAG TPA: SusC/RagA family TonB-linked outer membrane protein [Daejeonella sp.]|uniref:SusC/RagA family TonB-linked outer membrane protein n=1 Tax=Daejeonella sp. TaxID=2805397 RepID=UPI002ED87C97
MKILYQNAEFVAQLRRKTIRAMKLIAILTLAVIFQLRAEVHSQSFNFKESNTTVKQMFKRIEKNSNYSIFYRLDQVNLDQKINVVINEGTIENVMNQVLFNQPLTFEVVDEVIVVKKISNLMTDLKAIVRGQVTDSKGITLPGVSVKLKGGTLGTSTDAQGNYSFDFPENSVLVFSYIGYVSQEIPVSGRSVINIVMVEDLQSLSEVVVTALGITRDKKALAYSLTEVKGDSFTQARENNLGNALSGKIAGVNASSTATGPGGSSRVIIRGNGSLSGDNQPLYVVNGVPINNSNNGTPGTFGGRDGGDGLISINPDDIETLSVLKGGPAAALYGSRAANGVILITTKSGSAQKGLGVEFNSTYTMENVLTIPEWQYEYGSGDRGLKPTSASSARVMGRTSWGAKLDGTPVVQLDGILRPYSAQKDNNKNFYNTGATISNTIALNGGTENANFRFSVSDMQNDGIIPNSGINRNTFNLSANANLSKKIIFEGSAQYNIELNKNRTSIADFTNNPNASVGVMATSLDVRTLDPGYDANQFEVAWADDPFVTNPYFAVNKVKNEDERRRFIGSFSTRFNISDFLYARARAGIDYFNTNGWSIVPTGQQYNNFGTYSTNRINGYETNLEGLIGFDKTFGKFSVNALVGGNQMYTQNKSGSLSSGNLNVPFNYFISNGASQSFTDNFGESAINSLFSSVDVGYNNYLYLSLSARQDWFSTLSPSSNSVLYPSLGLSFVFSDAMSSKPSWLDYGKIRTSWAEVGGGMPGPYGLDLLYSAGAISHLGQPLMTITGNTIPNPLKPFTSTTAEAGIEIRAFNNRFGADLTVYEKTTTNDIVSATIPTTSGYSSVSLNVGEMRNRGIEVLLTGAAIRSNKGLNWDLSFNMAYNENTVVKIAEGLSSLTGGQPRTQNARVNHYEGQPYGMIAGFKIKQDASGNKVYNNASGLPIQSTIMPLGRGVPPLTLGLTNTFRYKAFSMNFLLDGKFGAKIYTSTNAYGTRFGLDKRTVSGGVRESGVTVTGVDQNGAPFTKLLSAQDYFQGIAYSITDEFVYDADFIKLRQLTFGYTLPQKLIAKTPFQSANLSLVARNLWMVYNQTPNVDPESSYSVSGSSYGLENFGVPPTRSFGLNLLVKF